MSRFEKALWEKQRIKFPPHISFRGEVSNPEGRELSNEELNVIKWTVEPVVSATENIDLRQSDLFKMGRSTISPKTIISFTGMTDAATRVSGDGELEIHLGILFAFASLRATYQLISDTVTGAGIHTSDLINFQPPGVVIDELDDLMKTWDNAAKSGWRSITIPRSRIKPDMPARDQHPGMDPIMIERLMTFLVVGHELAHWSETIYKDAEWARMIKEVKNHYRSWLREDHFPVEPEVLGEARQLLKHRAILSNWVSETHADRMAYHYAIASATMGYQIKGDDARFILMQINVNMAIFFWILTLFEISVESRGGSIDLRTHPPATIRRSVFFHIEAKKMGMSPQKFLGQQFGAGMAATFLLQRIAEEYLRTRHLHTEQHENPE